MERSRGNRSRCGVALVAVVIASLVAFASLGGIGLAQSAVGLAQYQYGKKVTICHKGKRTIRIAVRAWPAHKRHGDTVGTCEKAEKQAKKAHAKKAHAKAAHESSGTTHGKKNNQSGKSEQSRKPEKGKPGNKGQGNGK